MAGNVNLNQGLDFINDYLKGLGINKKITSSQVASIFANLEKNEDGTVNTADFAKAVASEFGGEGVLAEAEAAFLEAQEEWMEFAGADEDDQTVSQDDIDSLNSADSAGGAGGADGADGAGGASGSGGGGGGAGSGAGGGGGQDPVGAKNAVEPVTFTGNETVAELQAGRQDQISSLNTLRGDKEAAIASVAEEQAAVDGREADYQTALDDLKTGEDETDENQKALNDLIDSRADKEQAVTDANTAISDANTAISDAQGDIDSANGEISSLQGSEPQQSQFTKEETYTDADGETHTRTVEDTAAYQAAHAEWQAELDAAEQQLAEAENALSEAQQQLTDAETQLETAELAVDTVDEQIKTQLDTIANSEAANKEQAAAAADLLNTYKEEKQALETKIEPIVSEIDAQIQATTENLKAYDQQIDTAKAKEEQEAAEAKKAEEGSSDPEDCVEDPIGFEFTDSEGNPVDLKLVKDDGSFDSVSDFLGSAETGISELLDVDAGDGNGDGIITGDELATAGVKFATVIDGQAVALSFDEIKEKFGISNIQIDISKVDPDYQGDQEFGVTVDFAEKTDKNGNVVENARTQIVNGYSQFQTAEEIKAMEGYGDLIGNYDDTYRDENGVLIDLPEQFQGSEYAEMIHVDENGNYYLNVDVSQYGTGEEALEKLEDLDEIIDKIYGASADGIKSELKAALKIANAEAQNEDLFISGAKGTIKDDTKDGMKLYLVDATALQDEDVKEALAPFVEKSEGNSSFAKWADEAAAAAFGDGLLSDRLTANQGYTRDSEGKKILDETGAEFNELLTSLTDDVMNEDGTVKSTPEEAWANADLSQYSDETILKLAEAFEQAEGPNGKTFLETAQYYCGNGQNPEQYQTIVDGIMSKADTEQSALDMITRELKAAVEAGDTDSLDSLLNAASDNRLEMKNVLEQYKALNNGISLKDMLDAADLDLSANYVAIIEDCEAALSKDTEKLVNALGSSTANGDLSGVAEKAWESLDIESMTSSEFLEVQKAYDAEFGEGAFLKRCDQVFDYKDENGVINNPYDRIMQAIDGTKPNSNTSVTLSDGSTQTIDEFIESLDYANGIKNLATLSDQDIANVKKAYDAQNGDGQFEVFMSETQTEYEPSKAYMIHEKLTEGVEKEKQEAAQRLDEGRVLTAQEIEHYASQLIENEDNFENTNFAELSFESIAEIAKAYSEKMEAGDKDFFRAARFVLDSNSSDFKAIANALVEASLTDTTISNMLISNLSKEHLAEQTMDAIMKSVSEDSLRAYNARVLFEKLEKENSIQISDYIEDLGLSDKYVDKVEDIMIAPELDEVTREQIINLSSQDDAIAMDAWSEYLALNLSAEEVAQFAETYDYYMGCDGVFLSNAKEVSDLLAEEQGIGTSFDDIVDALFDAQGNYEVNSDAQITYGGQTYTAEELSEALTLDRSLWTKELFDSLADNPEVLNSVVQLYPEGVDAFTKNLMNVDGYDHTLYSEVKTKLGNMDIAAEEAEKLENQSEFASQFKDFDTLEHVDLIEQNAKNLELMKNDPMLKDDYAVALDEAVTLVQNALNDQNVPVQDKIAILEHIAKTNSDTFASIQEDIQALSSVFNEIATVEDAIAFADTLGENALRDNLVDNSTYKDAFVDKLISLYAEASSEERTLLNERFDLTYTIQQKYSWGTEDVKVENLFDSLISTLPEADDISAYASTETEEQRLAILKDSSYITSSAETTIKNILEGYNNGNLSANEASYLLKAAGYTPSELAAGFRGLSSDNEEKYMPVFLSLFQS